MNKNKFYAVFYSVFGVVSLIIGLFSKDYQTSLIALIGAFILALCSFYWLHKFKKK